MKYSMWFRHFFPSTSLDLNSNTLVIFQERILLWNRQCSKYVDWKGVFSCWLSWNKVFSDIHLFVYAVYAPVYTVAHKCNGETKSHGKTNFNSRHNKINLQSNERSRQNIINSQQNNINSRQNNISSRQNTINSRQNKQNSFFPGPFRQ